MQCLRENVNGSVLKSVECQRFERLDFFRAKLESSHKMEKELRLQLKICTDENQVLRETQASAVEKAQSLQTELHSLQEVSHFMQTLVRSFKEYVHLFFLAMKAFKFNHVLSAI